MSEHSPSDRSPTYRLPRSDHAPAEEDRERLRRTFDEDAARYDRARPGYPAAVFDELASEEAPPARLLEIGCGTGQATRALAARGYRITAVELGAGMAALARRRLESIPEASAEVIVAPFEEWRLPPEPFDVVFCATAFHWLDPAVRVARCAAALRPGGLLAVLSTQHVAGGSERFFAAAQRCYERFDPSTPPGSALAPAADFPQDQTEFLASGRFGPVSFFRYEEELTYSAEEYRDVLLTYSGHRAMAAPAREGLLDALTELIAAEPGGRITKRYLFELRLTRRH